MPLLAQSWPLSVEHLGEQTAAASTRSLPGSRSSRYSRPRAGDGCNHTCAAARCWHTGRSAAASCCRHTAAAASLFRHTSRSGRCWHTGKVQSKQAAADTQLQQQVLPHRQMVHLCAQRRCCNNGEAQQHRTRRRSAAQGHRKAQQQGPAQQQHRHIYMCSTA
jgi:hypothetical protein